MAFSDKKFEETFPAERSPRAKGFICDVRVYWNDSGTILSMNGVPLTGAPGDEANTAEAMDTFRRIIERANA